MPDLKWTDSEKRTARRVFEAALAAELAEVMSEFKQKAAGVSTADEMWALETYLGTRRREIEAKYDFRYSQLLLVFGALLREGRVQPADLRGLSDEKIRSICRIAAL